MKGINGMMKRNWIKNIKAPVYILIGTLFSYVVLTLLAFVAAFITNRMENPAKYVGVAAFVTLILTAALSCYLISRLRGEGGGLLAILSAAGFVILRIVISLFLSGTDLSDLLDCLCYLGTGAIFALLGQKRPKRRHR